MVLGLLIWALIVVAVSSLRKSNRTPKRRLQVFIIALTSARLADGRVAHRLRKPRSNGATHMVMTPIHFLARLAALVSPRRDFR